MSATYDFLTALKALTEGRCKGIAPTEYTLAGDYLRKHSADENLVWSDGSKSVNLAMYLGQWTLVDEKREPQPWSKPEHVPGPVCWIRITTQGTDSELMIHTIGVNGVRFGSVFVSWDALHSNGAEYSTTRADGSWKPCTVEFK